MKIIFWFFQVMISAILLAGIIFFYQTGIKIGLNVTLAIFLLNGLNTLIYVLNHSKIKTCTD